VTAALPVRPDHSLPILSSANLDLTMLHLSASVHIRHIPITTSANNLQAIKCPGAPSELSDGRKSAKDMGSRLQDNVALGRHRRSSRARRLGCRFSLIDCDPAG
jgi:hypothetical protein